MFDDFAVFRLRTEHHNVGVFFSPYAVSGGPVKQITCLLFTGLPTLDGRRLRAAFWRSPLLGQSSDENRLCLKTNPESCVNNNTIWSCCRVPYLPPWLSTAEDTDRWTHQCRRMCPPAEVSFPRDEIHKPFDHLAKVI